MRSHPRTFLSALAGGTMLALAGCGDDPAAPPPPAPVASVSLDITIDTLRAGSNLLLTATARDSAGNPLSGRTQAWVSSDPMVATVGSDGTVTGVAPGNVNISVAIEGQTAMAQVAVYRGTSGNWAGGFDLGGGTCPIEFDLSEDAMGNLTGTGNILAGGPCGTFNGPITGTNNTGGVADSVMMDWAISSSFTFIFEGNFDGADGLAGVFNGGGCVDCPTTATRDSVATFRRNARFTARAPSGGATSLLR